MSFKEKVKHFAEEHPYLVGAAIGAVCVGVGAVIGGVCLYHRAYSKGIDCGWDSAFYAIEKSNGGYVATNGATNKDYVFTAVELNDTLKTNN